MSGGPGGGVPDCSVMTVPKLQKPPVGSQCRAGDMVTIGWNGGRASGFRNSGSIWSAYLVASQDPEYVNTTIFQLEPFYYGDSGWYGSYLCGNTQMEYNWTIPANLTASPTYFRYVLVKESAAILGGTAPAVTESLPSTSNGGTFSVLPPATTTTGSTSAASSPSTRVTTTTMSRSSSTQSLGDTAPGPTSPSTDAPPSNPGLSTGAKVGIGVGVGVSLGVLLICLAAGVFFLHIRRRDRLATNATSADTETQARYDKAELDAGGHGATRQQQQQSLEADGRPLSELMAEPVQIRLPPQRRVELSGTTRIR